MTQENIHRVCYNKATVEKRQTPLTPTIGEVRVNEETKNGCILQKGYDSFNHGGYRESLLCSPVTTGFDKVRGGTEIVVEAYGICSAESNSMNSGNPYSGIYKADTSRTLDNNGGNPNCNQGGLVICKQNGGIERKICPKTVGTLIAGYYKQIGNTQDSLVVAISKENNNES